MLGDASVNCKIAVCAFERWKCPASDRIDRVCQAKGGDCLFAAIAYDENIARAVDVVDCLQLNCK
jgi:hypothetical protein